VKLLNSDVALKKMAAVASVLTALLLCLIKAAAVIYTGSLSVLSSMIDSLADVLSSIITFVAVRFSDRPMSEHHRYGYGKIEAVSALVQAAFIVGSAGFILYDGINRFIKPVEVHQTTIGLLVMMASLILTFVLIVFQKFVVIKTKSKAIEADSAHYTVDILSNLSVILSLFVVRYLHWQWFDIVVAVLIAIYLIINAGKLTYDALSEITDAEVDDNIKNNIIDIVCAVNGVKGYHDFRSRVSGARMFIEIHLELDGNLSLYTTHAIVDKAEEKIIAAYPQAQVIIHQDPFGLPEKRLDHQINGRI
jgi:ferrous-iron efflux pump FieF